MQQKIIILDFGSQTLHDAYGVVYRRLGDVYLLEASHERLLLGYASMFA